MLRCGLAVAALGAFCWCPQAAIAQTATGASAPAPLLNFVGARSLVASRASRDKSKAKAQARTPQPIPPLPERKNAKGANPAEAPPDIWQPREIEAAKGHCAAVLKEIDAVVEPQPPIKEGQCGAPAPVRLVSLGKSPQVSFSPAALVNCDMVAALHTWIKNDLQPLAAKHLGEKIVEIEVMSDYSCRTAFGRVGRKLSEHALADALDIRGFVTASGKTAHVLEAWGTTSRELAAQAAAAKKQAEMDASARTAADKAAQQNLLDKKAKPESARIPVAATSTLGTPGAGLAKRIRANAVEKIMVTLPGGEQERRKFLKLAASKLGGSKSINAHKQDNSAKVAALTPTAPAIPPSGPRARFLRAAHAAACRIFGTTLGPEANEAHRNHLHVDMAERKYKKICD